MYRTYYERRVNQLVDRKIQELVAKYDLKQKDLPSSKDNYMSPAESKVFSTTHNIVYDSGSDSANDMNEHNENQNVVNVTSNPRSNTTNEKTTKQCCWEELD